MAEVGCWVAVLLCAATGLYSNISILSTRVLFFQTYTASAGTSSWAATGRTKVVLAATRDELSGNEAGVFDVADGSVHL